MNRVVRQDAVSRYLIIDKRIFRPTTLTNFGHGDKVYVRTWNRMEIRVSKNHSYSVPSEAWVTNMNKVERTPKQPEGQTRIAKFMGGANLSVLISDHGKVQVNNHTMKGDLYLALNAGMTLTFDQFAALVETIFEGIEQTMVDKVTTGLKEDLDLAAKIAAIKTQYLGDAGA